ncbi:MAG: heterodisulfide reductase-related iron-sulfur binding cluster [Pirellulaceae bacterium]|nr:4Fe-4S dicluster domain-containing protein [Planctomycetales bacterium]
MNTEGIQHLETTGPRRGNPGAGIPYELFLDCVHCGLCTASCPTYVELGNENDSPRGRIYLMRAVTDGRLPMDDSVRRHLELCLDCRACESACPSGVQYGRLVEPFRVAMEEGSEGTGGGTDKTDDWFYRWILFGLFPYREKLQRSLGPARWWQRTGMHRLAEVMGLYRLLPDRLQRLVTMLPPLGREVEELPDFLPAKGERRARVALFLGCVGDGLFRPTNWATARVLQENGCDVLVPQTQACCGAIHLHAGQSEPARKFADINVHEFPLGDVDAVVTNIAGCGAMLKDYGHHWHDDHAVSRQRFADKVRDVHEFLDDLGIVPPRGPIPLKATYHDACHLAHAQKIREAPRRLLSRIPELTIIDLPESELCCGAAGTYNLTEPEMSARLSRRKLDNILATGARAVIAANAGCILQIAREARMRRHTLPVVHPIELLDLSYQQKRFET